MELDAVGMADAGDIRYRLVQQLLREGAKRGAARFHVACADMDGNVELLMQAGFMRYGEERVLARPGARSLPAPWSEKRAAQAGIRVTPDIASPLPLRSPERRDEGRARAQVPTAQLEDLRTATGTLRSHRRRHFCGVAILGQRKEPGSRCLCPPQRQAGPNASRPAEEARR